MNLKVVAYPRRALSEFVVKQVRERSFHVDHEGLLRFAIASGDGHPVHTDAAFAQSCGYRDVLVHGMCINSICSGFVAEEFVGSHGLLISMNAEFRLPIFCNELLRWRAEVLRVDAAAEIVEIKWTVSNDRKVAVQRGTACAWIGRHE